MTNNNNNINKMKNYLSIISNHQHMSIFDNSIDDFSLNSNVISLEYVEQEMLILILGNCWSNSRG